MSKNFRLWTVLFFLVYFYRITIACADDDGLDALRVPEASMNERVVTVPSDQERPVMLQVTIYTPSGPGPFPLVIMNHGSDSKKKPKDNPRYRFTFSAYYFLSRGYAVALPMMRGFAGSGGQMEHHGCDLVTTGVRNAKDIRAVLRYMQAQPFIDGSRVVVAGQSFGGWNTLALGVLNIPEVKGLINFSGGIRESDCADSEVSMAAGAAYFGERTQIPSIWFYGSNDKVFSELAWRAAYQRYAAAGGPAELVAYGNFMNDSHNLLGFPEGLDIWGPKVDAFLEKLSLPNQIAHPEFLPKPTPAATEYAALDDVNAVPFLTDANRQTYRDFLAKPLPRAFLLSSDGVVVSTTGGFDPLARALNSCKKLQKECRTYAIDNAVVWVKPTPIPASTHFAALDDVVAVPYLTEKGRQQYQLFLTRPLPRAFLISADGVVATMIGGIDPLGRGLNACKKQLKDCRPYAVNNDVVWSPP
ncbi:MAG: hypothetical protein JWM78_3699 [Verrucomicrobiaceae bacterium]|nr:hypothetical protein [Verrucomicrobiaceae bacterium]